MTPIDLSDVREISGGQLERTILDCGDFSIPGLKRVGEMKLTGVWGSTRDRLVDGLYTGDKKDFKIKLPYGGPAYKFSGFVTNVVDEFEGTTITIQPTGPFNVKEDKPVTKKLKIRNRFFVAAPIVTTPSEQDQDNTPDKVHLSVSSGDRSGKWTRHTLKDALAHAEQILANEPSKTEVGVVQIIKIVRRKVAPIVVETVRG